MAVVSRVGPLRLHWEVLLVGVGLGALVRPSLGISFVLFVVLHEHFHALWAGTGFRSDLEGTVRYQLGSGAPYVPEAPHLLRDTFTLILAPLSAWAVGWALAAWGLRGRGDGWAADVASVAIAWTAFQLSFMPSADGGLWLRRRLEGRWGRLRAWRISSALGLGEAALLAVIMPAALPWIAALYGLGLLLARSEVGFLRLMTVYDLLEAGRYDEVLTSAERLRKGLSRAERRQMADWAVRAALERGASVETFLPDLEPGHPVGLDAIVHLLERDHELGAREADRLHDAIDRERVQADPERYAELCFRHGIHEARRARPESAIGLLERATGHGFDQKMRLEAEPALERYREHPRLKRLYQRLGRDR